MTLTKIGLLCVLKLVCKNFSIKNGQFPYKTQRAVVISLKKSVKLYFYCTFATHRRQSVRKRILVGVRLILQNKCLYRISSLYEKRIERPEAKKLKQNIFKLIGIYGFL